MTVPTLSTGESGTLRCARHPGTETVLRCGKCETPICPRCSISTPVGARCPSCAQLKRFAMLLRPRELLRAVAYGVAAGAAGTILLSFIPFLGLIGYAILGFAVGEAVSVGANRKRARELGPLAIGCLFLGFELGIVIFIVLNGVPPSVSLLLAPLQALRGGGMLIFGLLLGSLLAWMRVR
ncbi:MAG TPA: B-box zinc finger protein [Chloroflexota bacterium]|jgi:hypothetical protein|nr:B-box zinc finger protein [Chloroflexota bacterium]